MGYIESGKLIDRISRFCEYDKRNGSSPFVYTVVKRGLQLGELLSQSISCLFSTAVRRRGLFVIRRVIASVN
jgi:hypothetical protein